MVVQLSAIPAFYNDYLERAPHEEIGKTTAARLLDHTIGTTPRKYCQNILARLVAVIAFPILASIDAIANTTKGLISTANKTNQHATLYFQEAEKDLLGLLCSPFGLISPDIVTRHFVPKNTPPNTIEAGGKYHRANGVEHFPKTVEEARTLVEKACLENKQVTIAGAHFSQSKDTLPTSDSAICINTKLLNNVQIDPEKMSVRAQAGATWADIQKHANAHGLAVKVMQASNVFSIGGSLGVNCHGWDHQTGTVGETVLSLTIIDASGKLRTLFPEDELFGLCIGGHGLFGMIVEAELSLCENRLLLAQGKKIDPKEYVEYFEQNILPNKNNLQHLYRLSLDPKNLLKTGVAVTYSTKTDAPSRNFSVLNQEPERGTRLDRILVHIARSFPLFRKLYWATESKKICSDVTILRNELMRPPINAAFTNSRADAEWLQEYFVKGKDLALFLEKLSTILSKNEVCLLNASVRYVKKDQISRLAYAKDEDHYAIVLFFTQSLAAEEIEKTKKWVQEVIEELKNCSGTFYLPYAHLATKEQFLACYPDTENYKVHKAIYDPENHFCNGFAKDYLN